MRNGKENGVLQLIPLTSPITSEETNVSEFSKLAFEIQNAPVSGNVVGHASDWKLKHRF